MALLSLPFPPSTTFLSLPLFHTVFLVCHLLASINHSTVRSSLRFQAFCSLIFFLANIITGENFPALLLFHVVYPLSPLPTRRQRQAPTRTMGGRTRVGKTMMLSLKAFPTDHSNRQRHKGKKEKKEKKKFQNSNRIMRCYPTPRTA